MRLCNVGYTYTQLNELDEIIVQHKMGIYEAAIYTLYNLININVC